MKYFNNIWSWAWGPAVRTSNYNTVTVCSIPKTDSWPTGIICPGPKWRQSSRNWGMMICQGWDTRTDAFPVWHEYFMLEAMVHWRRVIVSILEFLGFFLLHVYSYVQLAEEKLQRWRTPCRLLQTYVVDIHIFTVYSKMMFILQLYHSHTKSQTYGFPFFETPTPYFTSSTHSWQGQGSRQRWWDP